MKNLWIPLKWEYLKWLQSIKTSLTKNITYKINFLFILIVPIFVFFFIKYNLWVSIYEVNSTEMIKGYNLQKMIQYQFGMFLFELFVRSHFFSQNLSGDIRLGRISSFLLYPFSFISYQFSLFLSDKIVQFLIGCLAVIIALVFDFIPYFSLSSLLSFFVFIIVVNVFWFFIQTFIGFLTFWIEETWSINICFRFIVAFLSGAVIPLELYPELLQKILVWTPFPYLAYFPIKVLIGDSVPLGFGFVVIGVWVLLLIFATRWIWNKGLTLYTGSGI